MIRYGCTSDRTSDCPEYQQVDELLTGFAHEATLSHAGEIVQAVKDGQIRHFFLIGGCDGAGRDETILPNLHSWCRRTV